MGRAMKHLLMGPLLLLTVVAATPKNSPLAESDATFESLAQVAAEAPEWCKKVPLDRLKSTPPCVAVAETLLKLAGKYDSRVARTTHADSWEEAASTRWPRCKTTSGYPPNSCFGSDSECRKGRACRRAYCDTSNNAYKC